MKNKEFREIQVSSSALVFIFLAVLVLGVFIFLLGVSVGKKQAHLAGPATLIAQGTAEPVTQAEPVLQKEPESSTPSGAGEVKSEPSVQSEAKEPPADKPAVIPPPSEARKPIESTTTARAEKTGMYYVQVGAFLEKSQASTFSARFKKQGYPSVIMDPLPTDKKTVYRVRVGGYATREAAVQALAKINAAAGKKTGYYVTKD
jgi:cell division protein FtsN